MSFYAGKNVLVAGGTGLIGRPVVEMLLEAGARVRVASLDPPERCPPKAEFVRANLVHWEECRKAVDGMDLIFNLLGVKGSVRIGTARAASFMVPHLLFNTHLMEAARQAGAERYLYTSSVCVYPPAEVFREDDAFQAPPDPTDRFAAYAKRVGEMQAEAYASEHGWSRVAIVRPANVYGPWDNFDPRIAMVIPSLIARAVGGENPLAVWGDGSAVRDFIFARDCARGMLLALEKAACLKPVNLGSGEGVSLKQVAETVRRWVNPSMGIRWDAAAPSGSPKRVMDVRRARDLLGFRAEVSLEEGLRETVEWYRSHAEISRRRYDVFSRKNYMDRSV